LNEDSEPEKIGSGKRAQIPDRRNFLKRAIATSVGAAIVVDATTLAEHSSMVSADDHTDRPSGLTATKLECVHDAANPVQTRQVLQTSRSATGQIVFQDDFQTGSSPTAWRSVMSADGGSISYNTTYPFRGTRSLALVAPPGNSAWIEALKYLPMPNYKRLGLEFYFAMPAVKKSYLQFGMEFRNKTNNVRDACWIFIYPSGFPPLYSGQDGSTNPIAEAGFPTKYDVSDTYDDWHYAKIVADFANRNHARLQIDDVTYYFPPNTRLYDFSGTPAQYNQWEIFATFYNLTADASTSLLADVTATMNEP